MKHVWKISLLSLVLMGLVACRPDQSSRLQEDEPRAGNPFPLRNLSDLETRTVAARIGYIEGDGNPADRKCIGCHQNFNDIGALDRLYGATDEARSCFDEGNETKAKAQAVLSCLTRLANGSDVKDITSRSLGFLSAGVEHPTFKKTFVTAGREADYEKFKAKARMPLGGTTLPAKDFEQLLSWVLAYYPNLSDFLRHDGPGACRTTAETRMGTKVRSHVQRMSEGGQGWEYVNLSRGVPMFACSSNDKHACFTQQKGGQDIFALSDAWKAKDLKGHVRILHKYEESTHYWIRSSADGRFVGNGGEPKSAIIDLQPRLSGKPARKITAPAQYDPGFFPDNSGFIFQGSAMGTSICDQSILNSATLTTIDFKQEGCSKSDLDIGLYQAIGNSLDSGDIHTLTGSYASDSGYETNRDVPPLFSQPARIRMETIRRVDGRSFEKVDTRSVPTPYHGSWTMSPSNQLVTAILSGSKNGQAYHGGFRLLLVDDAFAAKGGLPDWQDESTALICTGGGEKANVSFDERMLTFYRYAKQDYGVNSVDSSSDIYVYDLLKGKAPVAITAMPKGFYAQFPHYRSDGWLYFSVYDAHTKSRVVAATDVSLSVEESAN